MAEIKCGFATTPEGVEGFALLVTYGPTLKVDVGFDPAFKGKILGQAPMPGIQGIAALVDTGAMESCIDSLLAAQLKLPIR